MKMVVKTEILYVWAPSIASHVRVLTHNVKEAELEAALAAVGAAGRGIVRVFTDNDIDLLRQEYEQVSSINHSFDGCH
jgi:hypothetical protein